MSETGSWNEAVVVTFAVIRRVHIVDGTDRGMPARVIQEADGPTMPYTVVVTNDGRIGWVLPHQIR